MIPRALLALLALAPLAAATPLGLETQIVATQTPQGAQYEPSSSLADTGGRVLFVNADLRAHDVVSVATGPMTNEWCDDHRFRNRPCPLFASGFIRLGETSEVQGIGQLTPLSTYEFFCSIHPWMEGSLTAI